MPGKTEDEKRIASKIGDALAPLIKEYGLKPNQRRFVVANAIAAFSLALSYPTKESRSELSNHNQENYE